MSNSSELTFDFYFWFENTCWNSVLARRWEELGVVLLLFDPALGEVYLVSSCNQTTKRPNKKKGERTRHWWIDIHILIVVSLRNRSFSNEMVLKQSKRYRCMRKEILTDTEALVEHTSLCSVQRKPDLSLGWNIYKKMCLFVGLFLLFWRKIIRIWTPKNKIANCNHLMISCRPKNIFTLSTSLGADHMRSWAMVPHLNPMKCHRVQDYFCFGSEFR